MDLRELTRQLVRDIDANRSLPVGRQELLDLQALCVAEEAGELMGAYRRWTGRARRYGSMQELEDELADVLIVTSVFAARLGVDIDKAVGSKLEEIYRRGWKEEPVERDAV